jgi:iron-sulfur cluster assembly accessory protein
MIMTLLHLRRLPLILASSSLFRRRFVRSVDCPRQFSSLTSEASALSNPSPASAIIDNGLITDSFILTPRAALRLLTLRKERGQKELRLRIKVESGGCSGFKYEFHIENTPILSTDPADVDLLFSKDGSDGNQGVPVVIDSISFGFIKGSALDWDDSNMMRQSFVITGNPQAESSCGCKSSFAVKTS